MEQLWSNKLEQFWSEIRANWSEIRAKKLKYIDLF